MERVTVVSHKHLPSKPLAPLWWWLYLEVIRRTFVVPPVWTGVLYTVLVLAGIANTVSFFRDRYAEPEWQEAPHD